MFADELDAVEKRVLRLREFPLHRRGQMKDARSDDERSGSLTEADAVLSAVKERERANPTFGRTIKRPR